MALSWTSCNTREGGIEHVVLQNRGHCQTQTDKPPPQSTPKSDLSAALCVRLLCVLAQGCHNHTCAALPGLYPPPLPPPASASAEAVQPGVKGERLSTWLRTMHTELQLSGGGSSLTSGLILTVGRQTCHFPPGSQSARCSAALSRRQRLRSCFRVYNSELPCLAFVKKRKESQLLP